MTWIEALLQFLRQFVPLVVVRDGQQGVRFVFGHAKGPYKPRLYLSLPMVWEMVAVPVAEKTTNLLTLSFTTRDGKAVSCSANINHEVTDALRWLTCVQEGDGSIAQEAMKYLHRSGRRVTFDDLLGHQRLLERRTLRALERKADAWGVRVIDFGLTDLVEARQYRLFADPASVRGG